MHLQDALRDRFVCGLKTESMQKRLLTEAPLTFQKAVEIAVSVETAARESQQLSGSLKVNALSLQEKEGCKCYRCGRTNHNEKDCYYKELQCHNCDVILKTYTGEVVSPLGVIEVKVKMNKQKAKLPLYVVEGTALPLFGREWLKKIKLSWREIKSPKVEVEINHLVELGVISPVTCSEWATPIVPVVKRNGDVRICGDFKVTVNPALCVERYPIPRIEDLFASLAGGQRFTKLDLSNAYLKVPVAESSRQCLTITTSKGLFCYNRLPFGIASAPAIFQRAMDQILQGLPNVHCYLDDILVTGSNDEQHLKNVDAVLSRLNEFGLYVQREKCEDSLEYLGHIIDAQGLHKSPEKVRAIVDAPAPKDVSQLCSFLGLINYYSRFIPNLTLVLAPLNALLCKGKQWLWSHECEDAFDKAKKFLLSQSVLTHYNPQLPVRLACDASPYGVGAVISHILPDGLERPTAFASRTLSKAEQNYAQIEREALGIVFGVRKFYQYLYGQKFTLLTDHHPLTTIFSPTKAIPSMAAARMQRWALLLAAYDYDIQYRDGAHHCNADGLSRLPLPTAAQVKLDTVELLQVKHLDSLPVLCSDVCKETRSDSTMPQVMEMVATGHFSQVTDTNNVLGPYVNRKDELTMQQGCLMWGWRVVIPPKLRSRVLAELHTGHPGVVRMKAVARSYVWWPGIDAQIEQLSKTCHSCQQTHKAPGPSPLHPWKWPESPWHRIHVDFAGPFEGHTYLVVVDAHSKWPEVCVMESTTSTKTIQVLRGLFSRYGLPEVLVSDNGPQFTSDEFQTFLKANGVTHTRSAPFHPATNGLAERLVQTFKRALRCSKGSTSIQQRLDTFLLAYRNTPHATTKESPAMLFLHRRLRCRLDMLKANVASEVEKAQSKLCQQCQVHAKDRTFAVGDKVLVRDYRRGKKWTLVLFQQRWALYHTLSMWDFQFTGGVMLIRCWHVYLTVTMQMRLDQRSVMFLRGI
ncbi:uncharacterized protein K02A2.6-like [Megalobrama amblycephala]|uniref:uncharacterized protein K02A2.6-like n=1 Tax=Megalobrama amblycephala TaxID=75352 RepID=UPI002013FE12|nr:uncharacterized protein K02A2.6-like [Megalobrama amblycephala]